MSSLISCTVRNACVSALLLVLMAAPVEAEDGLWKDNQGNHVPDTASRKSVNGVGGWLLVTSDKDWEAKWNTSPDTIPNFNEAHTVAVGNSLRVLTFVANPTQSADGAVHVTCAFSMQKPDGTFDTQKQDVECLSGKVTGSSSTLYLTRLIVGFLGEKTDPPGKWIVRVTIKDLVKGSIIPLETTFVLQ